jgi:ribonuclease HI
MPVFPPSSWSAPETNEPDQQRNDDADRRADRELKRHNVRKITSSKKEACAESNEDADHAAKKPRRKKSSEYIEGGSAHFRAATQGQ